jgi:two-component system, chemotaxis family, chemotaxis protein CheY
VHLDTNSLEIEAARPVPPRRDEEDASERQLLGASKGTILVIDDDQGIREALAEILEMSGYRVAVAADGQEGVELLEVGLEPSAIVLDLMMPRMDGWTFLERLRQDPKHHGVPVVVTSAVAAESPAGADYCLQKPFDVGQLDRAVARLCAH